MDDLISYPHNLLDEVTCYFAFALMQEITYPFFLSPCVYISDCASFIICCINDADPVAWKVSSQI